mmetsp:Transcript_8873/g.7851  ORF Transcript_8873/g.7851 Transcript_8873/m.7851 type:complete len:112 (+) Transcript_8873:105-440(+)
MMINKMGNFGFTQVVEEHIGKPLFLQIYNLITRRTREVKIIPNKKWGGDSLLGSDIRFENYSLAHCSIYYVEALKKSSPAAKAGLVAKTDYIVASKDFIFEDIDSIGLNTK